ncbi:hypothetical protein EDD86DRAFT_245458 [Gorgonomyces haynaldii]|nr:hypothetical protein EDD86DRAFT_245458 [Gorgonomyces haynaldii]
MLASEVLEDGLYSDITVSAFGQSWKLHRIILVQSSFLNRLIHPTRNWIALITNHDPQLTFDGICLRDMYLFHDRDAFRKQDIHLDNVCQVLISSCFLELDNLQSFCTHFILEQLSSRRNIISFASQIDLMKPLPGCGPYGEEHRFRKNLKHVHQLLDNACLSALTYSLSKYYVNDQYFEDKLDSCSDLDEFKYATPEQFLGQLPLSWIRRMIGSNSLCVPSEFERYQLVKATRDIKTGQKQDKAKEPKGYISTMFQVLRKRSYDDLEEEPEDTTWDDIFESSVIYTFMNFKQLEQIKQEGIVEESRVLSSHWLQTELKNGESPDCLPPIRFSCKFENIFDQFKGSSVLPSESVVCAGTQYRLLLKKEDSVLKALLQRSKGTDPYQISYEIYCVDHRQSLTLEHLTNLLVPVTVCHQDGTGYAYGIDLVPIKSEMGVDEIWLTAVIKLHP